MRFVTPALLVTGFVTLVPATAIADVNVYTTREPALIKPLLDAFTAESGIAVKTVFVEKGLPERVKAEGEASPADVLMTVDFGNLIDLVEAGVTQPMASQSRLIAVSL